MKKIIFFLSVLLSTFLAEAKTEKSANQFSNDSSKTEKIVEFEQKLLKHEKEIEALKKENLTLKKEVSEVKSRKMFPIGGKRVTVSRTGSKQAIVE